MLISNLQKMLRGMSGRNATQKKGTFRQKTRSILGIHSS